MRNTKHHCPFCDKDFLLKNNSFVHEDENKLLMKNKFPVLEKSYPLVYIEHDTCEMDITNYPKDVLIDVVRYGLTKWLELKNRDEFEDVLFFKNHGPYSAGSISHPHMQIVGLYDKNPVNNINFNHLDGAIIQQEDGFEWSISQFPFGEHAEFTVRMRDTKKLTQFAQAIQYTTHFIVNHLSPNYKSFNLCFYHINNEIIVKIFDRRPPSPLLIGYSLSQVPDNLDDLAHSIRRTYSL